MASSSTNLIDTLNAILDNGQVSNLCTDCCPCSNVYFFGSVQICLDFLQGTNWIAYSNACNNNVGYAWYTNCCTDSCFEKLSEYLGPEGTDSILQQGVVEYSLLGNKSMLCILYDYIIENNVSPEDALEIVNTILDKGVAFVCKKDDNLEDGDHGAQVLGSIEVVKSYAGTVDLFCSPIQPGDDPDCEDCLPSEVCCLTINSSTETYGMWAEAVGLTASGPVPP
jgi:hypothetical protein